VERKGLMDEKKDREKKKRNEEIGWRRRDNRGKQGGRERGEFWLSQEKEEGEDESQKRKILFC